MEGPIFSDLIPIESPWTCQCGESIVATGDLYSVTRNDVTITGVAYEDVQRTLDGLRSGSIEVQGIDSVILVDE